MLEKVKNRNQPIWASIRWKKGRRIAKEISGALEKPPALDLIQVGWFREVPPRCQERGKAVWVVPVLYLITEGRGTVAEASAWSGKLAPIQVPPLGCERFGMPKADSG